MLFSNLVRVIILAFCIVHQNRLVNHGEKQYSDGKGNHINGLEGFWGYLKRKTGIG